MAVQKRKPRPGDIPPGVPNEKEHTLGLLEELSARMVILEGLVQRLENPGSGVKSDWDDDPPKDQALREVPQILADISTIRDSVGRLPEAPATLGPAAKAQSGPL
jgi:hypothetical protein